MNSQVDSCSRYGQPLTQVGQFWVCPQHGQTSLEKPFAPFESSSVTATTPTRNSSAALKADLAKRGHDIWFDKSEIKFGDDWRRSITEAITSSQQQR